MLRMVEPLIGFEQLGAPHNRWRCLHLVDQIASTPYLEIQAWECIADS